MSSSPPLNFMSLIYQYSKTWIHWLFFSFNSLGKTANRFFNNNDNKNLNFPLVVLSYSFKAVTSGERQAPINSSPRKRGGRESSAWSLCLAIPPAPVKKGRNCPLKGKLGTEKKDRVSHRRGKMLGRQKQESLLQFPKQYLQSSFFPPMLPSIYFILFNFIFYHQSLTILHA